MQYFKRSTIICTSCWSILLNAVKYVLKCSEVHTYWDCTADGHGPQRPPTQQTWSGFSPTTVPNNNRQSGFSPTTVPKLSTGKWFWIASKGHGFTILLRPYRITSEVNQRNSCINRGKKNPIHGVLKRFWSTWWLFWCSVMELCASSLLQNSHLPFQWECCHQISLYKQLVDKWGKAAWGLDGLVSVWLKSGQFHLPANIHRNNY